MPLSVTAGSNFSFQAMLAPGVSQSVILTTWVAPMLLSQASNTRQSPKQIPGSLRILLLLAQMLGHLLSWRYQHRYQETVHRPLLLTLILCRVGIMLPPLPPPAPAPQHHLPPSPTPTWTDMGGVTDSSTHRLLHHLPQHDRLHLPVLLPHL
jgi:hypothetical protein